MQYPKKILLWALAAAASASAAVGQDVNRSFTISSGGIVEIHNPHGRVEAYAPAAADVPSSESAPGTIIVNASSANASLSGAMRPEDLKITSSSGQLRVEVGPLETKKRIDLKISMPPKIRLKIETVDGEVRFGGDIHSAEVRTDTGTIAADVPTDSLRYSLLWTASKPRFLSDFELSKIKEKSAGKFVISGSFSDGEDNEKSAADRSDRAEAVPETPGKTTPNGNGDTEISEPEKKKRSKPKAISLDLETARGIILLNIPPNEVTGDLRERPLTEAAKAIVRSGDSLLMEAIRRAVPKYYGDYTRTLPPLKLEPQFAGRPNIERTAYVGVKVASVRVSDVNNRSVGDLTSEDFEVLEGGEKREIVSVRQSTAPFNLVLLLDVSGSVDSYVDFIRKAARNFVTTVDSRDRVAIVTFNDDVHLVSRFTTDKPELSASLDTFDAGGATAYYDALAYTLADTLRPLKGERTAIVVLTDGDDNRSFLPFDSMLASIQESGALIYPLYVPSGLIAASQNGENAGVDSLRSRYLQGELTSKAKGEGERLAKASGGVYYEISKLSQIQTAYEDIVRQLRTAYEIEYRSQLGGVDAGVSPRLRIRTKQPNTYVQIRTVGQRTAARN